MDSVNVTETAKFEVRAVMPQYVVCLSVRRLSLCRYTLDGFSLFSDPRMHDLE